MKYIKVILTGDIYRTDSSCVSTQLSNIDWLYSIVSLFITNIEKVVYLGTDLDESKWLNNEYSLSIYNIESNMLVIGFELNYQLINYCIDNMIDYISLSISPIRFCNDLLIDIDTNLDISTNDNFEDFIKLKATILRNYLLKKYDIVTNNENNLLIIGQTYKDKSVLLNKKFYTLEDFDVEIDNIVKNYDHVYYKKHPYCNSDIYNKYELIDDNVYKLLSNNDIKAICALSSSVLEEAVYFNKHIYRLLDNKINHTLTITSNVLFSKKFWIDIVNKEHIYINHTESELYNLIIGTNSSMRDSLYMYWSYIGL